MTPFTMRPKRIEVYSDQLLSRSPYGPRKTFPTRGPLLGSATAIADSQRRQVHPYH